MARCRGADRAGAGGHRGAKIFPAEALAAHVGRVSWAPPYDGHYLSNCSTTPAAAELTAVSTTRTRRHEKADEDGGHSFDHDWSAGGGE